ncbi:MAG: hypothetical protein RR642_15115 [Solibacillus sp.]
MKKLTYFFYVVGIISVITFIYDLVKLNSFNWKYLAVAICMISSLTLLKIEKNKVS